MFLLKSVTKFYFVFHLLKELDAILNNNYVYYYKRYWPAWSTLFCLFQYLITLSRLLCSWIVSYRYKTILTLKLVQSEFYCNQMCVDTFTKFH